MGSWKPFCWMVVVWAASVLGGVASVLAEPQASEGLPGEAAANGGRKLSNGTLKDGFSMQGDSPLYIKSEVLDLDAKARVFTYRGNVEIAKEDLLITADQVVGEYDEQNRIRIVTAGGNVVITRGEGLKASAERAVYRLPEDVIELSEGPELYHHGSALTADKVVIYVREDRSEAEGHVRVKVAKTNGRVEKAVKGESLGDAGVQMTDDDTRRKQIADQESGADSDGH